MNRRIIWLICLSAGFSTLASAQQKPWIEVRSPHFQVFTNGSEADGRRVALDFEKMRYVFATKFPGYRLESGAPLLIFAARDEDTAKSLEPLAWKIEGTKLAGDYTHGWEKQLAFVRLDLRSGLNGEGLNGEQAAFHEYTHSILHLNLHWLPTWLDEGIAEFYAYTQFESSRIVLGAPSPRLPVLLRRAPIPIETLLTVTSGSPWYRDDDKVDTFYGESWALVHYMTYGCGMGGGEKINEFYHLLQKGVEQKAAFQQEFGDPKKMDSALSQYYSSPALPAEAIPLPPHLDANSFTARRLSVAETEAQLAAYHLAKHYSKGARPLVEQALQDDPKLGLAHEVEGFLLFQEGKTAEATDQFSQAFTLDPTLYLSLFAKSMLSPLANSNEKTDQATFKSELIGVLGLNPQFAPAYVQLARLALRLGDLSDALNFSTAAEELEPWRAGYHLQTGQVLLRMGKGPAAAAYAQFVAPRWIGTDHNEAVELWNAVPADQRPAGDVPQEIAPKDSQRTEGIVQSITCGHETKDWALVLNQAGQTLTFHTKLGRFESGFSDTLWYGEDHFNSCHNLEGLRAVVHYEAPSDSSYAGDVVMTEFRNDLPASPPAPNPPPDPATAH